MSKHKEGALDLVLIKVFLNTMPKARRRYYYRKSKKHWASHIEQISLDFTASPNNDGWTTYTLCQNGTDLMDPTPILLKTGNYNLDLGVHFYGAESRTQGSRNTFSAFLMYLPQGIQAQTAAQWVDLIKFHPEWVMWMKQYVPEFQYKSNDTLGFQNILSIKVSNRMKRNLNSGDKVVLLLMGETGQTNQEFNMECHGWVRYYTRVAN